MGFRERSAWMCLISILLVQVPYFAWTTPLFLVGPVPVARLLPSLMLAVLLQSGFSIAVHVLIARQADPRLHDERDDAIAAASVRRAYFVLMVSLVPVFALAMIYERTISVAAMIQLLFAGWVLAELVRYASQCWDYRRSVAGLQDRDA